MQSHLSEDNSWCTHWIGWTRGARGQGRFRYTLTVWGISCESHWKENCWVQPLTHPIKVGRQVTCGQPTKEGNICCYACCSNSQQACWQGRSLISDRQKHLECLLCIQTWQVKSHSVRVLCGFSNSPSYLWNRKNPSKPNCSQTLKSKRYKNKCWWSQGKRFGSHMP